MTVTPQDAQAKVDKIMADLETTPTRGTYMVQNYGSDWTKWPAGIWKTCMAELASLRGEIGKLVAPSSVTITIKGPTGSVAVGSTVIYQVIGA